MWKAEPLSAHVRIINGGTPSTKNPSFWNGNIGWLSVDDFNKGTRYVCSAKKTITEAGLRHTTLLRKGQLIISARGTVGVVAQLGEDLAFNQSCFGLDCMNTWTNNFLYYYLSNNHRQLLMMSKVNVFNSISADVFDRFYVPVPSETEQRRISSVLTAADDAIAASRALAEKYAAVMQGLMRDLLGKGERVRLDSGIVQINPYCREKRPDLFYYIDLGAVIAGEITKNVIVSRKEAPSRAQRLLKPNDILFQTVRPYQQNNYLFRKERELKTVASTGYAQIRTDNNPVYMYYALHQDEFVREVNNRSTGSNYPAINPTELGKCSIRFEPDSAKQDRIADILTAADERLTAEWARLAKLENIKRGLMDDLLTNRVSTDTLEGGREYA